MSKSREIYDDVISKLNDGDIATTIKVMPIQPSASSMSLRDWFAGQALASLGTWTPLPQVENLWSEAAMNARADFAYRQADAMLAACDASR